MSVTDEPPAPGLAGGADPADRAGWREHPPRMGFFTDTSVCIGCKACEVACKEWNAVPEDGLNLTGMSFDNTVGLSGTTWRHVAFIEQIAPGPSHPPEPGPQQAQSPSRPAVAPRARRTARCAG